MSPLLADFDASTAVVFEVFSSAIIAPLNHPAPDLVKSATAKTMFEVVRNSFSGTAT